MCIFVKFATKTSFPYQDMGEKSLKLINFKLVYAIL